METPSHPIRNDPPPPLGSPLQGLNQVCLSISKAYARTERQRNPTPCGLPPLPLLQVLRMENLTNPRSVHCLEKIVAQLLPPLYTNNKSKLDLSRKRRYECGTVFWSSMFKSMILLVGSTETATFEGNTPYSGPSETTNRRNPACSRSHRMVCGFVFLLFWWFPPFKGVVLLPSGVMQPVSSLTTPVEDLQNVAICEAPFQPPARTGDDHSLWVPTPPNKKGFEVVPLNNWTECRVLGLSLQ